MGLQICGVFKIMGILKNYWLEINNIKEWVGSFSKAEMAINYNDGRIIIWRIPGMSVDDFSESIISFYHTYREDKEKISSCILSWR